MNTVGLYLASTVGLTPIFSFYLGAFANLRKATISFDMSFRPCFLIEQLG